jgi:hypothetical protein
MADSERQKRHRRHTTGEDGEDFEDEAETKRHRSALQKRQADVGGLHLARLARFAVGMVVGAAVSRDPHEASNFILSLADARFGQDLHRARAGVGVRCRKHHQVDEKVVFLRDLEKATRQAGFAHAKRLVFRCHVISESCARNGSKMERFECNSILEFFVKLQFGVKVTPALQESHHGYI